MTIPIFGGLKPITSRLILDIVTLLMLFYAILSNMTQPMNLHLLLGAFILTVSTAGLTAKWTLLFPMIPLILLQFYRRIIEDADAMSLEADVVILNLSVLLVCVSTALCILFPAVELAEVKGPYNVGVIDMHLPVNFATAYTERPNGNGGGKKDDADGLVTVRILYPTKEKVVGTIPYVRPKGAKTYLAEALKFGAPSTLKKYGWILHSWLLTRVKAKFHAQPAFGDDDGDDNNTKMPIVIFSHGVGGVGTIYSYQTMSLAAQGYFVVALDHADGSAPVMWKNPQEQKFLDQRPQTLWLEGLKEKGGAKKVQGARLTRDMTEHRAKEMLAATLAICKWNSSRPVPELPENVSFAGKLDLDKIIFMGHSHGGATALTAGFRRPELTRAIVAHEPSNERAPDDIRRSYIPRHIAKLCPYEYTGATGGFQQPNQKPAKATIQDMDVLVLWSHEWFANKWGSSHILDWMHKEGKMLTPNSEVDYIEEAHHTEFSDTSVMTPLWLGRKVGLTGKRNPLDTGRDIHQRTLQFLRRLDTVSRSGRQASTKKVRFSTTIETRELCVPRRFDSVSHSARQASSKRVKLSTTKGAGEKRARKPSNAVKQQKSNGRTQAVLKRLDA